MKKFLFLLLTISAISFLGCDDDDNNVDGPPEYTIEVLSPDATDKHNGDDMTVRIRVTEKNNKTVHHFQARIYQDGDESNVLFDSAAADVLDGKHVHEEDGDYTFEHTFQLNVTGHHDYILETKVWGHEAGMGEVENTMMFHIHPM